jgi:hypothetical protein
MNTFIKVLLILFTLCIGMLVYYMFSIKRDEFIMPKFKTYDEFQKSKWFLYIKTVYGSVPQNSDFPLNLTYFAVLYKSVLYKAGIDIKKYSSTLSKCPYKQNQLFINMSWDPPDIIHLAKIPPYIAVNSGEWVEILHCGSGTSDPTILVVGNWMYIAPGSGIFFNVGNTISFPDHPDAVKYFLKDECTWKGKPDKIQCADQFVKLFTAAKDKGYDSIQFTSHGDQRCGLMAREIVDVKGNSNFSCGDSDPTSSSYYSRYKAGWNNTRDCICTQDVSKPYAGCLNCEKL